MTSLEPVIVIELGAGEEGADAGPAVVDGGVMGREIRASKGGSRCFV